MPLAPPEPSARPPKSLHFTESWQNSNGLAAALRARASAGQRTHSLHFSKPLQPLVSQPRVICSECQKSRRAWCNACYISFLSAEQMPAPVELPVHVDVLQHKSEKPHASSTVHLKLMAPTCAHVYPATAPPPDYVKLVGADWKERTAVLLPGDAAVPLSKLSRERLHKIQRLVVLDSNWTQAAPMMGKHAQVRNMLRVELDMPVEEEEGSQDPRNTGLAHGLFWRHKKSSGKTERKRLGEPDMWLSTAEAVYVACTQIEQLRKANPLEKVDREDMPERAGQGNKVSGETEVMVNEDTQGVRTNKFDDLLWTYMMQHEEAIGQMSLRYDLKQSQSDEQLRESRKRRKVDPTTTTVESPSTG